MFLHLVNLLIKMKPEKQWSLCKKLGFHKSVNSDVFANYNIVTYTRCGDVVHSTSYNSECYESSATSSDKNLSVSGTSIVLTEFV